MQKRSKIVDQQNQKKKREMGKWEKKENNKD
jgi:hypothetical protein